MTWPRIVAGVALILAVAALEITVDWESWTDDVTAGRDLPWVAPGRQARLFDRSSICWTCRNGVSVSERWGLSYDQGVAPADSAAAALRYLGPLTGLRLMLVSLFPTVLLLIPDPAVAGPAEVPFGTSLADSPGLLWSAPDLDYMPAPVPWSGDRAELPLERPAYGRMRGSDRLVLQRGADGRITITRPPA